MKKTKVMYWIFTALLVVLMGVGAIPDILYAPEAVALFAHLGYPSYLLPFLGVAKLLGILAILIPGFPRIKEWAYAGFTFDLVGAMYSGIAVGDPVGGLAVFIIGFIVIGGSYVCYHRKQRAASLSQPPGLAA
ncbi:MULTISPECIES: DoxX family protein [unclassified Paenibacillus]|uniref:DoxX family protein n=1 Tax=unclassified Paenibacillus TaxID=185978 RepID=UPI00277E94DC|nr:MULTISPECIES: DoxX family protein [unclassified Paenibacillus]MDQ0902007.1 putative membrane protein YphA (DoxX/SURF4 family) [Paenibacillus sp. V4I7]MDQ0919496.1 putative membrane protein YphA (DoxX/SURF4 family) [Paenibacillus sp. V4I5]